MIFQLKCGNIEAVKGKIFISTQVSRRTERAFDAAACVCFLFYLFLLFMQIVTLIFLLDAKPEIIYNAFVETTGLD